MNRFKGLVLGLAILIGCTAEEDPILPVDRFTKIYDSEVFDADFIPMDVQQYFEGYIILAGRRQDGADFMGVTILLTDLEGNFVQKTDLQDNYIVPSPQLLSTDDGYHFTCMESGSLVTQLVTIDRLTAEVGAPVSTGLTGYPLALSATADGDVLLLTYNPEQRASVLSELDVNANVQRTRSFTIGAGNDALVAIVNHLTREGSELPFFVGQTQEGNFYFNGLYNYTMSLVFTDLDSDAPLGVVQGQETHTGLYCALSLGEGQFAIASYSFNERFFQGQVAISESGISATVGLEGNPIPELDLNSHVEALSLSDNFLAFGADSRDRQIMLYAYSKADGGLVGTQYYGFGLPYTFGGMSTTADGGLIIAGSVYVADRFQRVALIKLAEEDVNALVLGTVVVDQE